jgi:hypothetical protein
MHSMSWSQILSVIEITQNDEVDHLSPFVTWGMDKRKKDRLGASRSEWVLTSRGAPQDI